MSKKNKIKVSIIALTLALCLVVAGVSAYFTDSATATNTFTVGKVEIELEEPKWDPDGDGTTDPDDPNNPGTGSDDDGKKNDIVPGQEIEKDPQVTNVGANDAFIFMEVIVPYANVATANPDGTKNDAADTELFSYTINTGWVEMELEKEKDTDAGTVTHVYAFGTLEQLTALKKGEKTPAIFDKVKFANIVEDTALEGAEKDIVVNAYAIQTTNINGGKVDAASVWEVVKNSNPEKD